MGDMGLFVLQMLLQFNVPFLIDNNAFYSASEINVLIFQSLYIQVEVLFQKNGK